MKKKDREKLCEFYMTNEETVLASRKHWIVYVCASKNVVRNATKGANVALGDSLNQA